MVTQDRPVSGSTPSQTRAPESDDNSKLSPVQRDQLSVVWDLVVRYLDGEHGVPGKKKISMEEIHKHGGPSPATMYRMLKKTPTDFPTRTMESKLSVALNAITKLPTDSLRLILKKIRDGELSDDDLNKAVQGNGLLDLVGDRGPTDPEPSSADALVDALIRDQLSERGIEVKRARSLGGDIELTLGFDQLKKIFRTIRSTAEEANRADRERSDS